MKISLITVTYNSAKTLEDTINSVLKQNYNNIEYIIIDGNSSDNTVDIIKKYEPHFNDRMQWISEPDNGLYDAMNKGIKIASGDVVGIINSDDFYHRTDIIQRVIDSFVKDKDLQVVFGDVRFVNHSNLNRTVRYYSSRRFTPKRFRFGWMPAHPTFFTYKKNFEKCGLYRTDLKIAADFELLVRFLYKEKLKYKYMPLDFMKMRLGGKSTASFKSNITLNKEILRACKEHGIYTNTLLIYLKYFEKIWEFVKTKEVKQE